MKELIHEDDYIKVLVTDTPGAGGACHKYEIWSQEGELLGERSFQNGPILENGVNGTTNEAELAIVAHRLEGFRNGQFPHRYTSIAHTHVETAKMFLEERTRERKSRGVEGKNVK